MVVLAHRLNQLARPSHIATENGVDAFLKDHRGPGSMTLRRWFDYEALSFATIAGAFNALGMTVDDMGGLLAAALVGPDKPPYAKEPTFRLELRPDDLSRLNGLLNRFERALGTDAEAEFIRRLTGESTAALRESVGSEASTAPLRPPRRAPSGSRSASGRS